MKLKFSIATHLFRFNPTLLNYSVVLFFMIFSYSSSIAQTENNMNPNTLKFANEVFKECPEYLTESHLQLYDKEVAKVSIVKMKKSEMPELKTLSSFGLKNKCNPSLTADFNSKDFNPLKYFFNFYSESDQYVRVDNSEFVIFIKGSK